MSTGFEAENALNLLHERINACRICSNLTPQFLKPMKMDRGTAGPVVVVGQGPGKTEVAEERAFAGYSGKRLNEWLVQCGASVESPRTGIYLTSVIKCCGPKNCFTRMAQKCRPFLNQQLAITRPKLVITLGQAAYDELCFTDLSYDAALCQRYRSVEYVMMTPVGFHYDLVAWPHPSGLNRWHNVPENNALLEASFELVRPYLISR